MNKKIFNWMMVVALMATPMVFTSCGDDDDDNKTANNQEQQKQDDQPAVNVLTVGFENQTLNGQGFWCGTVDGKNLGSYDDDWGGTTTTYENTYVEQGVTFTTNYNLYSSAYGNSDYWSGYAISCRTETSFTAETLTPDQYNNVTGKAAEGKNFCVVFSYGETIAFSKPTKVLSLDYTNSAYTANSILNGDNYSKKFDENDFLTCTVNAYGADSAAIGRVTIDLASKGKYVNTWQTADLSSFGDKVKFLTFSFDGSDKGDWGLNTPAYICIDKLRFEEAK